MKWFGAGSVLRVSLCMAFLLATLAAVARGQSVTCGPQWLPGERAAGATGQYNYAGTLQSVIAWTPPDRDRPELLFQGNFLQIGDIRSNGLASYDPVTDQWTDVPHPPVYSPPINVGGELWAIVSMPFEDGTAYFGWAKREQSQWTRFGPNLTGSNAAVYALVRTPQGQIFLGGQFGQLGGVPCRNIARWDGNAWQPLTAGFPYSVYSILALPDGSIVAGSGQVSGGSISEDGVARWDGTQWLRMGAGLQTTVRSLARAANGDIFAAIDYGNSGAVARWDGQAWTFPPGLPSNRLVSRLSTLANGDVLVCVEGNSVYSQRLTGASIRRWNGAQWASFAPELVGSSIQILPFGNGELIAWGQYLGWRIGNGPMNFANNVARFDGTRWRTLGNGFVGFALCSTRMPDSSVAIGGDFVGAGGLFASRVARWDGVEWSTFASGLDYHVYSLAATDQGSIYAGGLFTNYYARWDGAQWASPNPLAPRRFDYYPQHLCALPGDRALGGGSNSMIYVGEAQYALVFDRTGYSTTGPGAPRDVKSVAALSNGDAIASASFRTSNNNLVSDLRRWTGSAWVPFASWPGVEIQLLKVFPSDAIYAVTGSSGQGAVIQWTGTTWRSIGQYSGVIRDLARTANGEVFAGGQFTQIGGVSARNIARWDGTAWSAMGSGTDGTVSTLAVQSGSELVVGGYFSFVDGKSSPGFARYTTTGVPFFARQASLVSETCLTGVRTVELVARPARGHAGVQVQWRRSGVPLTDGVSPDGLTITGSQSERLLISSNTAHVVESYDCVLSSPCGVVESDKVAIAFPRLCSIADVAGLGGRDAGACGDGQLTADDLITFLFAFVGREPLADVAGVGGIAGPDGQFTSDDVQAFLAAFFAGCR